jgi:GntR family transcriptional regulator
MVAAVLGKEPRYLLVADALRQRIESQAPDSHLPSEPALAQQFGVSRVTIRRALGLLERSGLVLRERGRGTTVNPPKITRWISAYSFEEDLQRRGIPFETRPEDYRPREVPPEGVAQQLGLPETARVGLLSLVRVVDGRVVCYDRRYFPPGIADRFTLGLLEHASLPEVLETLSGRPLTAVDWETEIVPASREVAHSLGITPGVLVVVNSGLESSEDGVPVQAVSMHYRIDRVKFRFSIDRTPGRSRSVTPARPPSGGAPA